jgi:hypothetical protein
MQNSSRGLLSKSGKREFPAAAPYTEVAAPQSEVRATSMPFRDCSSEFPLEEAPTRVDVTYDHRDQESWLAPPRYSLVRPLAVSPAPERARVSGLRSRAAKLLFAAVLFAVVALLWFALR